VTRRWWRRKAQPAPDAIPADQPSADVPADLIAWAQVVDVSRLPDTTVRWSEDYLRRYRHMNLSSSREEGYRLVAVIETHVTPPPPIDAYPLDVIATVLTVRRR
jgi:hypothetical protein